MAGVIRVLGKVHKAILRPYMTRHVLYRELNPHTHCFNVQSKCNKHC